MQPFLKIRKLEQTIKVDKMQDIRKQHIVVLIMHEQVDKM